METIKSEDNSMENFVPHAIAHGISIDNGDYKEANKIHKCLMDIYARAVEDNRSSRFIEHIDHSNENVRLWSAIFTLKTNTEVAEKSLNKLAKLATITGLTAQTTLTMWKDGELDLI